MPPTLIVLHKVTVAPVEREGVKQTHGTCAPVAETQTMFHIVTDSCPLNKLDGGLSRRHSPDDDVVLRLANLGQ